LISGKGRGVHTDLGAYSARYLNGTRGCIHGGKASKACEADLSLQTNAEVKNGGAVPPFPICLHGVVSAELFEDKEVTTKVHISVNISLNVLSSDKIFNNAS
jgi:hypothetical protein